MNFCVLLCTLAPRVTPPQQVMQHDSSASRTHPAGLSPVLSASRRRVPGHGIQRKPHSKTSCCRSHAPASAFANKHAVSMLEPQTAREPRRALGLSPKPEPSLVQLLQELQARLRLKANSPRTERALRRSASSARGYLKGNSQNHSKQNQSKGRIGKELTTERKKVGALLTWY